MSFQKSLCRWVFRAGVFLAAGAMLAQTGAAPAQTARKALDLLLANQYPELGALFSDTLKKTITLDFLNQRVAAELREFGQPQNIGAAVLATDGPNQLISFPVKFSNTSIHVQFTLNGSGQIAGMYFRPADKPLPAIWTRPSYSKPDSFRAREVTIGDDQWKLSGTLTVPVGKTRVPGIVLVHGPGPNDRDESIFATRMFQDLAEGLASRGYAVLRYDKRTKVYGEAMSESGYTIEEETVADALRAVALLRKQPEADPNRIFLMGHSLGGYAAPRIAARVSKMSGLILLDSPARPIEDVSYDQSEYLSHLKGEPGPSDQARLKQMRDEVQKVKKLVPGHDNPDIALGLPSEWWLDVQGYDPVASAVKLALPILVLQGERDFQVTMKDFALWQSGLRDRPRATLRSYPRLNGILVEGERKSSPADFRTPGNVAPVVIDDISAWVAAIH